MSDYSDDHYAVLQVQPDAEPEVIEAAYRQLMRKYHPDRAGDDLALAANLHERAKCINHAYAILRDPTQRWEYDRARGARDTRGAPPPPRRPSNGASPPGRGAPGPPDASGTEGAHGGGSGGGDAHGQASTYGAYGATWAAGSATRAYGAYGAAGATGAYGAGGAYGAAGAYAAGGRAPAPGWAYWMSRASRRGAWANLLGSIASLYYFLPGPYEWERGRSKDLLATWMLPPLGVAGWSLSSGRLNLLTGNAPYVGFAAWALLAVLALPLWPSLPRLVLAGAPTALLLTGQFEGLLRLAGVPLVAAWIAAGVFGALVSARQYLFAVLPTLVLCWILANANVGIAAFGTLFAGGGLLLGWPSSGAFGALAAAVLIGLIGWLTLIVMRDPPDPAAPKPGRTPANSANPAQPVAQPQPATAQSQPNTAQQRPTTTPPPPTGAHAQPPHDAAHNPPPIAQPLFRRLSNDRVLAVSVVPLRTHRNLREPPSAELDVLQEANIVWLLDRWVFIQTDDGREGWAEWILSP